MSGAVPVSLWTLSPGPDPAAEERALAACLSPDEKRRHALLRVPGAGWSFAAAHRLKRHLLAARTGRPAGELAFVTTAHGRPLLVAPPPELPADGFSLSHAPEAVGCALFAGPVPAGAAIGFDIEGGGRAIDPLALASRVFHPREIAVLRAAPDAAARRAVFLATWTLKEALAKAVGLGFLTDFPAFAVSLGGSGEASALTVAPPPFAPAAAWRLAGGRLDSGHAWGLAVGGLAVGGVADVALRHRHLRGIEALV